MRYLSLIMLCCLFFLLGCSKTEKIVIYQTGNINGHYWGHQTSSGTLGGFAVLKSFLDSKPKDYLLFGGGDWFYPYPPALIDKGVFAAQMVNSLGYDVVTFGSGDFTRGVAHLFGLIKEANFAVVASNLKAPEVRNSVVKPYVIKEVNGKKIAVVGFVNQLVARNLRGTVNRVEIANSLSSIKTAVQNARREGAKIVVLLSSVDETIRSFTDNTILDEVPDINIIVNINGDSSDGKIIRYKNSVIVTANENFKDVLEISVLVNKKTGHIKEVQSSLTELSSEVFGQDASVKEQLDALTAKYAKRLNGVYGKLDSSLTNNDGSLVIKYLAQCLTTRRMPVAMLPGDLLKPYVLEDPVTEYQMLSAIPEDYMLTRLKMRGADIKKVLEANLDRAPSALVFAGLKVYYDSGKAPGKRISRVTVGGEPLYNEKIYSIASTSKILVQQTTINIVEFVNVNTLLRTSLTQCVRREKTVKTPDDIWIDTAK